MHLCRVHRLHLTSCRSGVQMLALAKHHVQAMQNRAEIENILKNSACSLALQLCQSSGNVPPAIGTRRDECAPSSSRSFSLYVCTLACSPVLREDTHRYNSTGQLWRNTSEHRLEIAVPNTDQLSNLTGGLF